MAASGGGAAGGGSVVWMAVWFCALWFAGISFSLVCQYFISFFDITTCNHAWQSALHCHQNFCHRCFLPSSGALLRITLVKP